MTEDNCCKPETTKIELKREEFVDDLTFNALLTQLGVDPQEADCVELKVCTTERIDCE